MLYHAAYSLYHQFFTVKKGYNGENQKRDVPDEDMNGTEESDFYKEEEVEISADICSE